MKDKLSALTVLLWGLVGPWSVTAQMYGPEELQREKFVPLPVPEKQLHLVRSFELEEMPSSLLRDGVRVVGKRYDGMTTETLIAARGWKEQHFEFVAALGCHLPSKHRVSVVSSEGLLILDRQEHPESERHVGINLVTAIDTDTSTSYRELSLTEVCEGYRLPTIRHRQVVIRRGQKILYFREAYTVVKE